MQRHVQTGGPFRELAQTGAPLLPPVRADAVGRRLPADGLVAQERSQRPVRLGLFRDGQHLRRRAQPPSPRRRHAVAAVRRRRRGAPGPDDVGAPGQDPVPVRLPLRGRAAGEVPHRVHGRTRREAHRRRRAGRQARRARLDQQRGDRRTRRADGRPVHRLHGLPRGAAEQGPGGAVHLLPGHPAQRQRGRPPGAAGHGGAGHAALHHRHRAGRGLDLDHPALQPHRHRVRLRERLPVRRRGRAHPARVRGPERGERRGQPHQDAHRPQQPLLGATTAWASA